MKKILIVNNNMKVGGVQKSLCSLLHLIEKRYEVTLLLFEPCGAYMEQLPSGIRLLKADSAYRYLGISQGECRNLNETFIRGGLAAVSKLFGRPAAMRLLKWTQNTLEEQYDAAISYLHNGNIHSFYGGVNEFVLEHVQAEKKIAFLHCDYRNCGGNHPLNNKLYTQFDRIAACSEGCRDAFLSIMPELAERTAVVYNSHDYESIQKRSLQDPVLYDHKSIHLVTVGRLAHEKALERAVLAVSSVRSSGTPAVLHMIGDGSKKQDLQKITADLGLQEAVVFEGEQENPYRFMRNADLMLLSSYHEAAPLVLDEAAALGLPVLTVRTSSADEMVTNRNAGWVCGNSQEELNQTLQALLQKPASLSAVHRQLLNDREQICSLRNETALRQFEDLVE
ncbi:MAG: glycosyltransferase [Lachnospiraceae bacterium]|nr:glycosyltransferase [Lachnospiraceae bacterium]